MSQLIIRDTKIFCSDNIVKDEQGWRSGAALYTILSGFESVDTGEPLPTDWDKSFYKWENGLVRTGDNIPPVPVPSAVTMRQARLSLLAANKLDAVTTAITTAGAAAQIEWDYATEVHREAGLVPQMALVLGMTDREVDDLFINAATL